MEIEEKIIRFEKRYKILARDFQAGKIDEARYIAEVDKLQLQDGWGRYWMIGVQSGAWHYYDGQNWQQADPREADRLPFMDDQGIYWQRGVKSGDWYYYQPETGEWVKPGAGDAVASPSVGRGQARQQPTSAYVPAQAQLQPQNHDAGPGLPGQLDGQLFQDDEGRYWAIGEKTGQWYFYDQNGWHPAHEFRAATPPAQVAYTQPYQPQMGPSAPNYVTAPYQPGGYPQPAVPPPSQSYVVQPQQPASPTQPIQIYITSPGQESQAASGQFAQQNFAQPQQPPAAPYQPAQPYAAPQPGQFEVSGQAQPQAQAGSPVEARAATPDQPAPVEAGPGQPPRPPKEPSDSGSWYYFDGQQWLKYATGEPDQSPQPPPKMVIEQQPKSARAKAEPKSEPVMAEFIEEDEPPVEVVDVEVITVIDPEPEAKLEPKQTVPAPQPAAEPTASPRPAVEEPRPRRASRPVEVPRRQEEQLQPLPSARGSRPVTEPNRAVPPRKREAAHEPTIIIPTGAAASNISSPRLPSARAASQPVRPAPAQQRRARENTLPMEPVRKAEPMPAPEVHRSVTQAMPTAAAAARADTAPVRPVAPPARQTAQQKAEAVASGATVGKAAAVQPKKEKEGYTVGDVLRSLPSTLWTFVGGVVILLACAVGLIFTWSWLQGDDLGSGGLVAVPSLTPTLDAGPPDATPTPGPTFTPALETQVSVTPAALTAFSSAALGYRVEYPENWKRDADEFCGIFSPSSAGLDKAKPKDAAMIICKSADEETAIADLLTKVLTDFPADAETLNEGTISIASQIWTSAQIRYESEELGGQGIATLAVTNKEGVGYYLVALAPAQAWNLVQPQFQAMINSFSFSTSTVAQAATSVATSAAGEEDEEADVKNTPTPAGIGEARATPRATPTPKGTATPLVYRIQSGDTLLAIAAKFGVSVDLLVSRNNITDPTSLQIGQELVIPFTAEELEAYNAGSTVAPAPEVAVAAGATPPGEAETGPAEVPAAAPPPTVAAAPSGDAAPVSGRIVYAAFNPGSNVYDIWMADIATGDQTIIATEASQPAFNRDGSLLAYRSWNLGGRGIYFRDFIGGREGRVTRFVEDGLPTWSPDGYSFAFASRREGDRVPRIFVGNQSGDGDYMIGFQGEYPATFPDGRLVVRGCSPAGDCGMYVMGASGGGERKISSEFSDTAPAVSPDGSKIAVMSSARGATNWEIWVMNADGSNPQRLTNNGSNEGLPAWSPDGKSIAYVSDQGGSWAVWVMNADGSNQRKLFNMNGSPDGKVLRDIDNSKGWLEERISWAP